MLDLPLITPHRNGLLFLCVENSARSQMAEGFARFIGPAEIQYYSAGSNPGTVNPYTIKVMKEVGIDINAFRSKSVDQIPMQHIATVITLCEEAQCPVLPEGVHHLAWPVDDPRKLATTEDDLVHTFRQVRDEIRALVSRLF